MFLRFRKIKVKIFFIFILDLNLRNECFVMDRFREISEMYMYRVEIGEGIYFLVMFLVV